MSAYIQLGTVRLDLLAYLEGFKGTATYAYAEHQIIDGKPHLQWTGDGLKTRTLTAQLHASFCDPHAQYQTLTAAAERHEALKLFFVSGIFEGDYVITQIQRTLLQTDPLGQPYAMTLELELQECVVPRDAPDSGLLASIGAALGMPPEQVVGTALAIASDPVGFAKATVANFAGALGGQVLDQFGPLGPAVNNAYSLIARQKVDSLLR